MHRRGVMHRDICPANIVIADDGDAVSGGFRVGDARWRRFVLNSPTTPRLWGHWRIWRPSRPDAPARSVDQRADLYALGATLYELATGQPPFGTGDPLRLTHDHLARVPAAPVELNPGVPETLSAIIMHLLEKEPDHRYQTAEGVLYDLERLRDAPTAAAAGRRA